MVGGKEPIVINIQSLEGGSVEMCKNFYDLIKEAEKTNRPIIVNINSYGGSTNTNKSKTVRSNKFGGFVNLP